jgi:protein-S-isoprenylcysteine O-methyltransferase Ste14
MRAQEKSPVNEDDSILVQRIRSMDLDAKGRVGPAMLILSVVISAICFVVFFCSQRPPKWLLIYGLIMPGVGAFIYIARARVLRLYRIIQNLSAEDGKER